MKKDHYAALELELGASLQDIKRAYRRLVRQYHPDSAGSSDDTSEERFHEIQEAYDVLSDPDRKKDYDALYILIYGEKRSTAQPKTAAEAYARASEESASHNGSAHDDGDTQHERESDYERMQRLHKEQGQQAHRPNEPETGSARAREDSSGGRLFGRIFDAVRGKRFERPGTETNGPASGGARASEPPPHQSGPRSTYESRASSSTQSSQRAQKPRSFERERIYHFTLNQLEALGESAREIAIEGQPEPKLIRVRVPAGITDGTILKVNCPTGPGGKSQTVRIKVSVTPHPFVTRQGLNITIRVPITVSEALSGASIEVPTFDGSITIGLPKPWKPDSTVVLRQKGLADPENGKRGDLIATFYVVLPTNVSDAALLAAKAIDQHNFGLIRESLPKKLG